MGQKLRLYHFDVEKDLGFNRKLNPDTTASAATVALSRNYDTHRITGSTTVDNLYVQSSTLANRRGFKGLVHLVLADGTTISDSGNITPKSTIARAAGSVATFYIDGNAGTAMEIA